MKFLQTFWTIVTVDLFALRHVCRFVYSTTLPIFVVFILPMNFFTVKLERDFCGKMR